MNAFGSVMLDFVQEQMDEDVFEAVTPSAPRKSPKVPWQPGFVTPGVVRSRRSTRNSSQATSGGGTPSSVGSR